jgi:hypothetical protein
MLADWMNPGGNNPTPRYTAQISTPMVCDAPWRKQARSANPSGGLLLAALARTKIPHEEHEQEIKKD